MKRHVFFGFVVVAILLLWGSSWYFIPKWYDAQSLEAGTFGDMFGAVNALFSGLAFAGLIYTIAVQRQEMLLQRVEMARAAEQSLKQQSLLDLQIAMTTINELIKNKNKRLESATQNNKVTGTVYEGIDGLRWLFLQKNDTLDTRSKQHFEYYLNSFIYILQYMRDSDLTPEQKNILAKLLDTDTSDAEIYMLYKVFHNDQHQLGLLKEFNFDARYDRIIKK